MMRLMETWERVETTKNRLGIAEVTYSRRTGAIGIKNHDYENVEG